MYGEILISQLNDFVFCPASIYFHMLYGNSDKMTYQSAYQINGSASHETVDNNKYSSKRDVLSGIDVYSEKYGLVGKIDIFYKDQGHLVERKRSIKQIYDGYIFQLYAQYFALREMGYCVKKLSFHSMVDNKNYPVLLPEDDEEMFYKFEKTIEDMHIFNMMSFVQSNNEKCSHCIYEPACDRGVRKDD